jgi:enoyl-CoA hydratase/carnithine racemase
MGAAPVSEVDVNVTDGVMEIRLNRPAKMNAMHRDMYADVADALRRLRADDDLKAVVFSAEGANFCAGNDLDEFFAGYDLAPGLPWRNFLEELATTPKPVVAAVQGRGVGIGMTMLLHCDAVFIEPDIRLSAPFLKLGLCPEAGSSLLLPRRVGYLRAMEIFTGRDLDAATALEWGIATAMTAPGESRATALAAAGTLASASGVALRETKRLVRPSADEVLAAVADEAKTFMGLLRSSETQAKLRAILDARQSRKA